VDHDRPRREADAMATAMQVAVPSGAKDFGVRVVKAFVAGALSGTTIASFSDLSQVEGLMFAGGTAAYSVVLNAILKWANSK
jgi:hypothetical protein